MKKILLIFCVLGAACVSGCVRHHDIKFSDCKLVETNDNQFIYNCEPEPVINEENQNPSLT